MRKILVLAAVAAGIAGSAQAADITGAGATFPFPIYSKWAEAYKKDTGIGLNYQSIGSGGGIRQIKAKTVAFGATDAPLKGEDLTKDGLIQFPTVMGGVVPAVNIAGIEPGKLKLSGEIIAQIYLGDIKKWNDPKIVALNAGVTLPDANINPVYRSDGSGTTFVFTDYLSKVSADWKSKIGTNQSVQWPVGIGGKGNEGVSASVKQVANSIGYVEYANANWQEQPGFGISLNNQKGADAWPITSATFILVHAKPEKPEDVQSALKFFDWTYKSGDKLASELDYVALPANVKDQVRAAWKGVTDTA